MTDMNELRAKADYGRYMADKRPQHGAQVEPPRRTSRARLILTVLVLALAVSLCSRGVDPSLKRICAAGYGSDEQCGRVQP